MSILDSQTPEAAFKQASALFDQAISVAQAHCNGSVMSSDMVPQVASLMTMVAGMLLVANAIENQIPK